MDNLTHSLTGLMMARAGLGRTSVRGGTLMLVLAANAPDLDGLSLFRGGFAYMHYHRGLLHSFAMTPVMALLALLVAHWIRGASIAWRTWFACLLGVLSHVLLDFTNVYGIRMFLPFSSRMPHLDTVELIDAWILLIFAIALIAPALAGMVTSEIRGAKSTGPKLAWAVFALIALLGYEGFRYAAHQRAIAVIGERIYDGEPARLIEAFPSGSDPLRWRGVIETSQSVRNVPVLLTQEYDPTQGEVDYPAPESPAINAARATQPFQVFLKFNQLPFWKVTPLTDATLVQLIDMRFGTPRRPGFASVSAVVGENGRVRDASVGLGLPGKR
jgi:inner membrane protein